MKPPDDIIRLRHLREAAEKAIAFSTSRTRPSLEEDELLRLGLTKLVEIVGEAAKPNCENCPVPVTGRAELHDEVVHQEQLWLTREADLLEHGPDHLAEPLEGLG